MGRRVLIVDDAPLMRGYLAQALRLAGHEVVGLAKNGGEAVEQYLQLKPDVVTMDMNMPRVDGLTALREILRRDPAARIVVITAMNQTLVRQDLLAAGAKAVLGKPARLKDLAEVVDKLFPS